MTSPCKKKNKKNLRFEGLKLLPTRIPHRFLAHTHWNTHTHTHTHTHTVMPAGRWRLAWCCHQGILGGVCRKGRGVNWVSAGCKALWAKAWCSSSRCFVTHSHPERYRWWARWGSGGGVAVGLGCEPHGCSFSNPFTCFPCLFKRTTKHLSSEREHKNKVRERWDCDGVDHK